MGQRWYRRSDAMLMTRNSTSRLKADARSASARAPARSTRRLHAAGKRRRAIEVHMIGQPSGVAASAAAPFCHAAAKELLGVARPKRLGSASIGGAVSGRFGSTIQRSVEFQCAADAMHRPRMRCSGPRELDVKLLLGLVDDPVRERTARALVPIGSQKKFLTQCRAASCSRSIGVNGAKSPVATAMAARSNRARSLRRRSAQRQKASD